MLVNTSEEAKIPMLLGLWDVSQAPLLQFMFNF